MNTSLIRHITFYRAARFLALAPALALLVSGCAARTAHQYDSAARFHAHRADNGRVEILQPLLAERIEHIAMRSPSFRDAWESIRVSGVGVRIGSFSQLERDVPRWYRDHPREWGGVTVLSAGARERVTAAVVVVRIEPVKQLARGAANGQSFLTSEIDRVLIHEIYGHLAPVILSGDAREECPDQLRAGESVSCVQLRERQVARELLRHAQVAGEIGRRP